MEESYAATLTAPCPHSDQLKRLGELASQISKICHSAGFASNERDLFRHYWCLLVIFHCDLYRNLSFSAPRSCLAWRHRGRDWGFDLRSRLRRTRTKSTSTRRKKSSRNRLIFLKTLWRNPLPAVKAKTLGKFLLCILSFYAFFFFRSAKFRIFCNYLVCKVFVFLLSVCVRNVVVNYIIVFLAYSSKNLWIF